MELILVQYQDDSTRASTNTNAEIDCESLPEFLRTVRFRIRPKIIAIGLKPRSQAIKKLPWIEYYDGETVIAANRHTRAWQFHGQYATGVHSGKGSEIAVVK